MATTFKRGQELSRSNGLNIFLKSKDGSPSNAANISYNIYDFTTGLEVLLPPSGRVPLNPAIGEYYANFVIPLDSNVGNFRIRWFFSQYSNSPQIQIVQEFAIVQDATQIVTVPGITPIELDTVRSLRVLLRDQNPARNYHFMPPSGEESVNQFTKVFGYIWEDCELLEYLRVANDAINAYPPFTNFNSIDQLITQFRPWRTLLLTGAIVYALQAVSLNWVADELSYSISGVSIDIEKSSKYQSMMNDAQSRFESSVTQSKEGIKIIRGLKQSKYGVGIRSSFGPNVSRGTLTPRRFAGL